MAKKGTSTRKPALNTIYRRHRILTRRISTARSRLVHVRLISMAMTGFFYTFKRPRTSPMMGLLKYDPIGTVQSLSRSLTVLTVPTSIGC